MKNFKQLIDRLRPANRDWQFMEIKELSEQIELAELRAREAIMLHRALKRKYSAAYRVYMANCKRRAWKALP